MPIKQRVTKPINGRGNHGGSSGLLSSMMTSSNNVWKFLAFLFLGIIILMATGSLQIKLFVGSDGNGNGGGGGVDGGGIIIKQSSGTFGAHVQQKQPLNNNGTSSSTKGTDEDWIFAGKTSKGSTTGEENNAADADQQNPSSPSTGAEGGGGGGGGGGTTEDQSTTSNATPSSSSTTSSSSTSSNTQNSRRSTYQRRGQPMNDSDRQSLIEKWGSWTFVDPKKDTRPTEDYYKEYPNRDIPYEEFPTNAWQTDVEYLTKFLPEAIALVERAQNAILAEYGKLPTETEMFTTEQIPHDELATATGLNPFGRRGKFTGRPSTKQGGWTTPKSWEGLVTRMLHAVMTEDNFIFAMAGHSAAAGHGNHFQQSYTLQVQWILEAVFARLGIKHQSRNFGNGGLGTIQHGLGAAGVFGPDVDVLMVRSLL